MEKEFVPYEITLLPTDKPSRLYEFGGQIILTNEPTVAFRNQNIYITSDEEIKEGNWFMDVDELEILKASENVELHLVNVLKPNYKKIILTTDQDLIKDGVQAIDDEFLEWFVNNPSCEWVETFIFGFDDSIISHSKKYEIIIPKEEPKQIKCYCGHTTYCDCHPIEESKLTFDDYLKQNPYIITSSFTKEDWEADIWEKWNNLYNSKEEQETLEEAAERLFPDSNVQKRIFIKGAKWQMERSQQIIPFDAYNIEVFAIKPDEQGNLFAYIGYKITNGNFHFNVVPFTETQQERMYSEEDMREAFNNGRDMTSWSDIGVQMKYDTFKEWFVQFKKK